MKIQQFWLESGPANVVVPADIFVQTESTPSQGTDRAGTVVTCSDGMAHQDGSARAESAKRSPASESWAMGGAIDPVDKTGTPGMNYL